MQVDVGVDTERRSRHFGLLSPPIESLFQYVFESTVSGT